MTDPLPDRVRFRTPGLIIPSDDYPAHVYKLSWRNRTNYRHEIITRDQSALCELILMMIEKDRANFQDVRLFINTDVGRIHFKKDGEGYLWIEFPLTHLRSEDGSAAEKKFTKLLSQVPPKKRFWRQKNMNQFIKDRDT